MSTTMYFLKRLVGLVLFSVLGACTLQYTKDLAQSTLQNTGLVSNIVIQRQNNLSVHPSSGILIARANSPFSSRLNRQVAKELYTALSDTFVFAQLTQEQVTLDQAFTLAESANLAFVLFPVPVFYTDNGWSLTELTRHYPEPEKRALDKFNIRVALFDVRTRRLVDLARINAASGFFSTSTMPEELLPVAFLEYRMQLVTQLAMHD